jgi:hypothetical protein
MIKNIIAITTIFAIHSTSTAQYSTYYNVNVNQNVSGKINHNVNVSGNIYEQKTITTIDYGALELANAQHEANNLENIKYTDEQQRRESLEIAADPTKAYDYGFQNTFTVKGENAEINGFKHFTMSLHLPNKALFVRAGVGRYENVSKEGVTTEINFFFPKYNKENINVDIEKNQKMERMIVGQLNDNGSGNEKIFVLKKDINRATVYGVKGFKGTLIWEDDYNYTITDNFNSFDSSIGNGVSYSVKVRTYGNKKEVTFEELEGRRYYLRQLIEKIISTAVVSDIKYIK